MALDIFHDDDRVVHHQPHGKHDGQEREQVDGEAEHQHQKHGADQRDGNGRDRNDDGAQGSHEKEDDQHHDDERLGERLDHLVDRVVDVDRRVVGDAELDPRWQCFFNARQRFAHLADHVQRVGGGEDPDAHERGRLPVEADLRVVVLGSEYDIGDFPEAHDRPVRLLDRQLAEFVRCFEVGVGDEVHRDHLALRAADRGEVIVRLERIPHVSRRNIQGSHAVGLEPDPHRKCPVAQDLGALDAVDGRELRLHDPRQVVGDLVGVELARVKPEIHRGKFVVRRLEFDGRSLGLGREVVPHLRHLRLDLGESGVGVVVKLQVDLDRTQPLRARGIDIVDPVGARDHALQRSRDVSADQVRIRADIRGAHRDHRHVAARVLADGKNPDGHEPAQQDQEVDDKRQHRAPDKNIGERHVSGPRSAGPDRSEAEPGCSPSPTPSDGA